MPCSIPGRAYQSSRSEFSMVSFETSINTFSNSLERLPSEITHPVGQVPTYGQLTLILQSTINMHMLFNNFIS